MFVSLTMTEGFPSATGAQHWKSKHVRCDCCYCAVWCWSSWIHCAHWSWNVDNKKRCVYKNLPFPVRLRSSFVEWNIFPTERTAFPCCAERLRNSEECCVQKNMKALYKENIKLSPSVGRENLGVLRVQNWLQAKENIMVCRQHNCFQVA